MKFINLFISALSLISATYAGNVKWTGFRYSTYGVQKSFGNAPDANTLGTYIDGMKNHFDESTEKSLLLTVGKASSNKCSFDFSKPENVIDISNVEYIKGNEDINKFEDILTMCDEKNVNVWLVVEPGDNKLVDLANIVLDKYGNHKSVKGFGVDLEWWHREDYNRNQGKALTDYEAKEVVTAIRKRNKKFTFLAKHWKASHMPEFYTAGMVYVNTAQSFRDITKMSNEFSAWANAFQDNPVMFEIGYKDDKEIWQSDPIKIANTIANDASKFNDQIGIVWTDYTMKEALEKM
ncbi:hypothetical protein PIROE2DRAFT_2239 [Piromyces sp. E2]|nr:hypothetical protein PIROE2DRAFT_2239 [Piromyces sp. E2]|eukprot:OUM69809.1 hypothetical protein PIROE2DRAFT_2239 [Piromyces sp. E2]